MSARASDRGRTVRRASGRSAGRAGRTPVSRTTELARKRERRSFRLRLFGFIGLLLILILAATYQFWLRDSSLVGIKNLKVEGISTKDAEGKQIDQAVRTAMGEMTTLHVQPDLLDQELARFPRVAGAEIETKPPDSATVTLDIRKDGAIYGEGPDALLIATDGTVLGPPSSDEETLPHMVESAPSGDSGDKSDESPEPTPKAGELLTGHALAQALVLGLVPAQIAPYVTESRMTADGVEVELSDGLVLLFGDASHADQKWRAAVSLIADPTFDTSSYVDLTVPRRPAVSSGAEGEATTEELPDATADTVVTG